MIGILLLGYGVVAGLTWMGIEKLSTKAKNPTERAVSHGFVAGLWWPFVAAWAIVKAHKIAIADLRGHACKQLPPARVVGEDDREDDK